VIRGAVVENFPGQPLSRASVLLEPVPGSPGTRMTAHTNRFGFFEFAGEPAGRWEFALAPVDGYYASGFSCPGPYRRTVHAEGWNEATVTSIGSRTASTVLEADPATD
jgi:hypothetical protein